ncbi:hypothetical protein [Pseudoalteromonas sp. S558]|uniref:hypothetical protein n=1 Tax=Pseudoalteromonas sp. S558 TaxID=2066515 RepID=UPI0014863C07|nr:hypothetical protein [Pseudoalteromonas sp. S558]
MKTPVKRCNWVYHSVVKLKKNFEALPPTYSVSTWAEKLADVNQQPQYGRQRQ